MPNRKSRMRKTDQEIEIDWVGQHRDEREEMLDIKVGERAAQKETKKNRAAQQETKNKKREIKETESDAS